MLFLLILILKFCNKNILSIKWYKFYSFIKIKNCYVY